MALSTSQRTLLITLLTLSILAATTSATRPCKTLFISSYSFSLRRLPSSSSSSGFVTVVTEISQLRPLRFDGDLFIQPHHAAAVSDDQRRTQSSPLLIETASSSSSSSSSYDLSSLRDRTRDILSVVVSLLFGVGCGALTAATMYLAWSLFVSRQENDCHPAADDDFYDASPKKMGYVKIPEVSADSATLPPSPVKEAAAV